LAIISKYPIIDTYFEKYNDKSNIDKYANKGFLRSDIIIKKDVKIILITTHMQAIYNDENDENDNNVRNKQINQFIKYLNGSDIKNTNDTVVLTGDFNVYEDSLQYLHTKLNEMEYYNSFDLDKSSLSKSQISNYPYTSHDPIDSKLLGDHIYIKNGKNNKWNLLEWNLLDGETNGDSNIVFNGKKYLSDHKALNISIDLSEINKKKSI